MSDTSDSNADGTYTDFGSTCKGYRVYYNGNYYITWVGTIGAPYWGLNASGCDGGSEIAYSNTANLTGTWTGATLVLGAC